MNEKNILVLSSITYAYKARDYLNSKSIKCYIERIPAHLRTSGCGYGVRVKGNAVAIADMLRKAGIEVKDIVDMTDLPKK